MRKSQSYNISFSLSPKYFPIHGSKFSPQQSNAYIVHGVNFCALRDQQRAGLGVAFPSAQVEGSALIVLCTQENQRTTRNVNSKPLQKIRGHA